MERLKLTKVDLGNRPTQQEIDENLSPKIYKTHIYHFRSPPPHPLSNCLCCTWTGCRTAPCRPSTRSRSASSDEAEGAGGWPCNLSEHKWISN